MAFRRGERGKCNEPVDDAGEHLVPHTHIGYAARDGRSWGSRLGDKAGHGGLTAASFVRGLMTMSRKTGMRGKAIAVICCLALLVGCTGCGALKEGLRRERQSQQGQSSQQGERIASSLKDYARSLLDSDGGKISDQQKSALEKAASGGKVSQADYERAWADYKQCIIDKGYAEPTFDKYDNGIYTLPSYNTDGASKEAIRKLNDDLTSCSMLHVTDINTVYRLQLGNPKLLLNDKEVAADCLRKEGIKPKDYIADKLEKDLESGESAGLRDNRKALTCLVTAGVNVTASDETVWYPLK